MKVSVFAGGIDTWLGEEPILRPKAMVEIGGKPILGYIIKIHFHSGLTEFVVLFSYKQIFSKEYFEEYFYAHSDIILDILNNKAVEFRKHVEPWRTTRLDTGINTFINGRIKGAPELLGNDAFIFTDGNGISDVGINELPGFPKNNGKQATLTAMPPSGLFSVLDMDKGGTIGSFQEKPQFPFSTWSNAGFFVLEQGTFSYVTNGDKLIWERTPLSSLAHTGESKAFKHDKFGHPVHMLKKKIKLNELWNEGNAPGKIWKDCAMKLHISFFRGKHVFVTGHNGFKGSGMCRVFVKAGVAFMRYSLPAPTTSDLFSIMNIKDHLISDLGDIREEIVLKAAFAAAQPESIIYLAVQSLGRDSYKGTCSIYKTNVMGMVNVAKCVRLPDCMKNFLNVVPDTVYHTKKWGWGYREHEPLNNSAPTSSTKSCSELLTHTSMNSFFAGGLLPLRTARTSNALGGDFAYAHTISDCVRTQQIGKAISMRNLLFPLPSQQTLEMVMVYLRLALAQEQNPALAGSNNVASEGCKCVTTGQIIDQSSQKLEDNARWENQAKVSVARSQFLQTGLFPAEEHLRRRSALAYHRSRGPHLPMVRGLASWRYSRWYRQEDSRRRGEAA